MRLEDILGDELNITVLRWLTAVRGGQSGNQIAQQVQRNQSSIRKALERLVETRVVTRVDIGNSASYALNEALLLTQAVIIPLFQQERKVRTQMAQLLVTAVQGSGIDAAVLYGSAAHGNDFRDIDILVVTASGTVIETVRDEVLQHTGEIEPQIGVPINPIVITQDQLKSTTYRALLDEVIRDGVLLAARNVPAEFARVRRPPMFSTERP